MINLTPQEIVRLQEFLKDKEAFVRAELESQLNVQSGNTILQAAVKLVFEVLNAELEYEFQKEAAKEADYYGYSR